MPLLTITQRVTRQARRRGLKVYTRRQWGSKHGNIYQWRRRHRPHALLPHVPSDTLVQHITVTFDSGVLCGDFKKDMQTIERIGYDRFKSGVSYNWVIDMETGEVGQGQSLDAAGTHTVNDKDVDNFSYDQNAVALAIAYMGMPGKVPSKAAINSAVQLIAAHIECRALTRGHDYVPHSLFAHKDCPTDAVRTRMPMINRRARRQVSA